MTMLWLLQGPLMRAGMVHHLKKKGTDCKIKQKKERKRETMKWATCAWGCVLCAKKQNCSLFSHTLMDFRGTWSREYWGRGTYVTPLIMGFKGHLGVIWGHWPQIVEICIIGHCIPIRWWIFMGLEQKDIGVWAHMWCQLKHHIRVRIIWVIDPKRPRYAQSVTVSTYFDGFSWDLSKGLLG